MGSLISKATSTEAQRVHRARVVFTVAISRLRRYSQLLVIIGVIAIGVLAAGFDGLVKKIHVDENAMLPGQSAVYFSQGDLLNVVDSGTFSGKSSYERAQFLETQLRNYGLESATQRVSIRNSLTNETKDFYNAYGIVRAPRASSTESVLLSGPWICMDEMENINGFNYLLSLAAYLPKFSHWSKDTIFLFSDGGLVGTRAWLEEYHGFGKTFHPDIITSEIIYHGGVIEEALNVEFSGTGNSYDSIGVYVQGLNGQQPNADIPMVVAIAADTFGVPIRLHRTHSIAGDSFLKFLADIGASNELLRYADRLSSLVEFMSIQAFGIPMSHHALFPKYKTEGISIVGVGQHGSAHPWRICLTMESVLRSYNSLLERLHHQYWFYFMFSINDYLPIAFYIGPVVLMSINLVFEVSTAFILYMEGELVVSVDDLKPKSEPSTKLLIRPAGISSFMKFPRPMHLSIVILTACYALCWTLYSLAWRNLDFINKKPVVVVVIAIAILQLLFSLLAVPALSLFIKKSSQNNVQSPKQWKILKSLSFSLLGMTLLTIATLNPSLSAFLALLIVPVVQKAAIGERVTGLKAIAGRMARILAIQTISPAGAFALVAGLVGAESASAWVVQLGWTGYWLEGWVLDAVVCFVWPLLIALQIVATGGMPE
ncbi:Glycosyl phosphatidyl inositol protein transamidase complex subunit [Entophlyctis luteolus]|nr:Glycosyl phosphatidyl inositol protein transamidase complex subunit [Entophlyctis luteolus]